MADNSASIRIRIVDPRFQGLSEERREEMVEPLLEKLPRPTQADIINLLTLSPDELEGLTRGSVSNLEFNDPSEPVLWRRNVVGPLLENFMPVDEILFEAEEHMEKALEHLKHEMRGLRTGRATTALVEYVKVDYYGTPTDLRALASLTTPDASSILIKPFDPGSVKDVVRALEEANLGINPQSDGKQIRMVLPALSGERRQQLVGKLKEAAEHTRISLRNLRRDANKKVDSEEKESLLTEDAAKAGREEVQELLKKFEGTVESMVAGKTREIMEV